MHTLSLFKESLRLAIHALRSHPLRTLLSCFGIIIGIFCIIGIFTFIDSLNQEFTKSLSSITKQNLMYVTKFEWKLTRNYPWWKYFRRPNISYSEYGYLSEYADMTKALAIVAGPTGALFKQGTTSTEAQLTGTSHTYQDIYELDITQGRYFLPIESESGRSVAIIGHEVASNLEILDHPIGKEITLHLSSIRKKFTVIGVLKKEGSGLMQVSKDNDVYIPYKSLARLKKIGGRRGMNTMILAESYKTDKKGYAESQIRMLLRQYRRLRPLEEDNFAINKSEIFYQFIETLTQALTLIGALIASFSITIGGFNIANIMFISVKERTFQIGLQKALGAYRSFILMQFLLEAVFLTMIGGVIGLILVYVCTLIPLEQISLALSLTNIGWGVGICIMAGLLSGGLPAYQAANMDPIQALRSGN